MELYLYSPICHHGLHRDSLSLALLWHFPFLLVQYSARTRTHTHIYPLVFLCVCISKRKLTSLLKVTHIPACCQHCMFLVKTFFHILFLSYTCIMSYEWLKRKITFYIRYFRIPSSKRPLTCRQKTVPFDKLLYSPSVYSRDAQNAPINSTVLVHDCRCTQDIVQCLSL
jgi:hypothetical protein